MTGHYAGPVIDPHHHLWDLSMRRHPWLLTEEDDGEEMVFGDIAAIRRTYGVRDYLNDASGQNVVATVCIEAGWAESHIEEESRWLATLDRSQGVARRHVARVPLLRLDACAMLDREAEQPGLVGIRDVVSWHRDPAKSFVDTPDLMNDPSWRRGLDEVARRGLVFDLMLYPWQMDQAVRLAADFPNILFVLNHCGSPADRSEDGLRLWRERLVELARADNVRIKISDPVAYDNDWTVDSLRLIIEHCIACFGTGRAMFASDFPVTGLHAGFAEIYAAFREIVAELSNDEQRDLFFSTANRTYRIGLDEALSIGE